MDGVDKKPGLDITTQELYDYLAKNTQAKITTSQVSPADLTDTFREGLKRAKHVLYIPISQGLSSTMSTAIAIARQDEFKGKVTVYQSNFITP
ncbi:MAG: hypothetical protein DRQ78_01225 [Epsilonproteobacteria bacterium]|nr:MAG: hypothetical protein DRQ78_01225 [Campylobacterota bacterium]